jgi:hypothetical protein
VLPTTTGLGELITASKYKSSFEALVGAHRARTGVDPKNYGECDCETQKESLLSVHSRQPPNKKLK